MIWTILGLSVAILAAFCIAVGEILVGTPLFENNRQYIAAALAAAGVVVWFVGRALAAKGAVTAGNDGEEGSRRFVLFDLRYWGPMLLAFGLITLFIRPLKSKAEPVYAKTKPVVKKEAPAPKPLPPVKVTPPPPPPVFPKLKMQGVIYRENQPFVIINGQSYTVGDHLGEVVVRSIDRESVMLEFAGEMKVLKLD